MIEPTRSFTIFVLAASAIVLGGALLSEYWGGLTPCELCLLQRWPWGVAIVIAFIATMVGSRPALPWVALLLAAVFVVSSGSPSIMSGSSSIGSRARALAAGPPPRPIRS